MPPLQLSVVTVFCCSHRRFLGNTHHKCRCRRPFVDSLRTVSSVLRVDGPCQHHPATPATTGALLGSPACCCLPWSTKRVVFLGCKLVFVKHKPKTQQTSAANCGDKLYQLFGFRWHCMFGPTNPLFPPLYGCSGRTKNSWFGAANGGGNT